MKSGTALILMLAASTATVFAQVKEDEHSAHHPPGTAPAATTPAQQVPRDKYAEQMKKMQDMHKRMQSAKTSAERQALMDEHMKVMQSGMEMMSQMGGDRGMGMGSMGGASGAQQGNVPGAQGNPGMGGMMGMHSAMEQRMTMMEQMMQMMVDREAAMPRK